jgi:hypothetical protein
MFTNSNNFKNNFYSRLLSQLEILSQYLTGKSPPSGRRQELAIIYNSLQQINSFNNKMHYMIVVWTEYLPN